MATTAGTAVSAAAANVAAAAAAGGGKTAAAAKATAQATVQATAVVASKTAVQLKSAASKYVGRRPEDVSDEEVVEHYFFYSADRPKQALRALLLRRHTLLSVFYPSFHDPMKVSSSRHSLPRPRNIHSPQHTDDAHSRKDLPPPAGTLFFHQRLLVRDFPALSEAEAYVAAVAMNLLLVDALVRSFRLLLLAAIAASEARRRGLRYYLHSRGRGTAPAEQELGGGGEGAGEGTGEGTDEDDGDDDDDGDEHEGNGGWARRSCFQSCSKLLCLCQCCAASWSCYIVSVLECAFWPCIFAFFAALLTVSLAALVLIIGGCVVRNADVITSSFQARGGCNSSALNFGQEFFFPAYDAAQCIVFGPGVASDSHSVDVC